MNGVAGNFQQVFTASQKQVHVLTQQITTLRQQGQGLQEGTAFLVKAASCAESPQQLMALVQQHGLAPCVTALQGNPQDQWTQVTGVRTILTYCLAKPQYLQELHQTNGFESVLTALRTFPHDMSLVPMGLQFFSHAA